MSTTLDVPCDGRVTFKRMDALGMRTMLLAAESRRPSHVAQAGIPCFCAEIIETYLRPLAYMQREIGA